MPHRFFAALLACGFFAFALSACDSNPTGVGEGVGPGFDGGEPVTANLEPTAFEVVSGDDVTGNSVRILAGRVDDPALGTTAVNGYLDVRPPASFPDGFLGSDVESARLVLTPRGETANLSVPDYVYGDTLAPMTLNVAAMNTEWDAETADETLTPGAFITESASFTPGDTVRIDLPDTWGPFSTLTDTTDFEANFHGFELSMGAGNAVVGFVRPSTVLEVVANGDTVAYEASRSFSSIARPEGMPSFEDRVLLQDGFGRALSFTFTLPDSLMEAPVSRAVLRMPTDTTLFSDAMRPDGFVRPRANSLVIRGFDRDSTLILAAADTLDARGDFAFEASQDVSLRQVFQAITLGESSVERFEVSVSQSDNTIDPLLLYVPGTGDNAPRAALTVTKPSN